MTKQKLLRTFKQYKAQFISMVIMIAFGLGSFLGFNMEWRSLELNLNRFFQETNQADYYIFSNRGFSDIEKQKLIEIKDIEQLERSNEAWVKVNDSDDEICLMLTEDNSVSSFYLVEGQEFDSASKDGVWLSDKYAKANGYSIGDKISVKYSNRDFNGIIKGLIKSPEYLILLRDSTQMMPDFNKYGFAVISPAMFRENAKFNAFYTSARIKSLSDRQSLESEINNALERNIEIVSKTETFSYGASLSEIKKGQMLSKLLPAIFLSVALFTVLGTMARITVKEKTQIGTLMALGFKTREIKNHYMLYSLLPAVAGSVCSIGIGYLISFIIMNPGGTMGAYLDMPYWKLRLDLYCLAVILSVIILISASGRISINKIASLPTAEAIRPGDIHTNAYYSSISGIHFLDFLSFSTKWNLRDILRHKARALMSILGVAGSMLFVVAAFGFNDSIKAYIDKNINQCNVFTSKISIADNTSNKEIRSLVSQYNQFASIPDVSVNGTAARLNIYSFGNSNEEEHLIKIIDEKGNVMEIGSEGAYICMRLASKLGVKPGDSVTVRPFDKKEVYQLEIAGIISNVDKCLVINSLYADKIGIDYKPQILFSELTPEEITFTPSIRDIQSKNQIIASFDLYMGLIKLMIAVLIAVSVVLGFCVLYNMGSMSFEERRAETVILKTIGFKDKTVCGILIQQNVWLSTVGITVGYFAGKSYLAYLISELGSEYEMLTEITPYTVVFSILIVLLVCFYVSFRILLKVREIDLAQDMKHID